MRISQSTVLSENPRAGRESLTNLPPHGKFWPSHHSPARPPRLSPSLAPILEFLYIYDACGIWKTTDKATQGHLSNHLEGRPKLSKVSCLVNNLSLLGVEHFFKEWVCWLLPEEEGRLILSYKYPLLDICLLENIWWSKLQPDIFQHDLIRVGLWRIVKVQPLRDMNMMKISLLWTGCPNWSGAGAGSSEPGFHVRGTVPKCKKCMGTLNPRCFRRAHGSCSTLKFLSKSMRLRALGGIHEP